MVCACADVCGGDQILPSPRREETVCTDRNHAPAGQQISPPYAEALAQLWPRIRASPFPPPSPQNKGRSFSAPPRVRCTHTRLPSQLTQETETQHKLTSNMLKINAINTQNEDTKKAKQNKPIQRVNSQSNRAQVRHTTRSTHPRQIQVQGALYTEELAIIPGVAKVNAFRDQQRSIR